MMLTRIATYSIAGQWMIISQIRGFQFFPIQLLLSQQKKRRLADFGN
jgi:hypothetical protein